MWKTTGAPLDLKDYLQISITYNTYCTGISHRPVSATIPNADVRTLIKWIKGFT